MKPETLLTLVAVGGLFFLLARRATADAIYQGQAMVPDAGWNYPPIYPDVTGSGAVDPAATWPGWMGTPPYFPSAGPVL